MTAPAGFNGCYNREPLERLRWVQSGWNWNNRDNTRAARMKQIVDPMTKDCQYTLTELGRADPGCVDCRWRADPKSE